MIILKVFYVLGLISVIAGVIDFMTFKIEMVSHEKTNLGIGEMKLTIRHTPGKVSRLLGRRIRTCEYIGSGMVWNSYPGYRRCSQFLEAKLHEYWRQVHNKEVS